MITREERRKLIELQDKDCCQYWMTMWLDIIANAIRHTDGGWFAHCPECATEFKQLEDY